MGIIIYFLPISSNKMCEAPDEYTGFNLYIPTISKPAYLIPLWSPCNLLLFLIGPKLWLNGPKKISRESLPPVRTGVLKHGVPSASHLELIPFEFLAAEPLRLIKFDNQLIIDCFANAVNIIIW